MDKGSLMRKNIAEWLKEEGFKSGAFNWDSVTHSTGMPELTSIMVKPKFSPASGACTILVTPAEVIRMTIVHPFELKSWVINYRWGYNSRDELKELLMSLIDENWGCWEDGDKKEET